MVKLVEVQTQGRGDGDSWIKSYKLKVTVDGSNWIDVENDREYPANSDQNTIVSNKLAVPVKC